jgi:hypothetical protein
MPSYPAVMQTHDFKFHNLTIRAVEVKGEPSFGHTLKNLEAFEITPISEPGVKLKAKR